MSDTLDFIHLHKPKLSISDSFFSWNFLTLAKEPIVFLFFFIISKHTLNILTNVFVFSSMCGSLARISLEHLGCGHSLGSFGFCQQLLPHSAHWFTQEPWINHLKQDQNVNFWYTGARPCFCVYIDQTAWEKAKKNKKKRKGILWDVENAWKTVWRLLGQRARQEGLQTEQSTDLGMGWKC